MKVIVPQLTVKQASQLVERESNQGRSAFHEMFLRIFFFKNKKGGGVKLTKDDFLVDGKKATNQTWTKTAKKFAIDFLSLSSFLSLVQSS